MASSAWSSIKSGAFNTAAAVKNAFVYLWNGIGNGTLQFFGISYSNWQKYITNTTTLISRLFKDGLPGNSGNLIQQFLY
ncbi:MAG: hypothetical protein HC907_17785 [Richelia sp. SM1_7_0]|nr:hypothetical protein [Richelia sp. SM1_7_0]